MAAQQAHLTVTERQQLAAAGGGQFVCSRVNEASLSLWDILAVPVGSDDEAIRSARKRRLRDAMDARQSNQTHQAVGVFDIQQAAGTLLDPKRRHLYELLGNDAEAAGSSLDADEIIPSLWLGSLEFAVRGPGLVALGVTHVLSVCSGVAVSLPGVQHEILDVNDREDQDLLETQHIRNAIEFISGALKDGGVVYVHCMAGVSRSATMVIAYLMKHRQLTLEQAFAVVKLARPKVDPNVGFVRQLIAFSKLGDAGDSESHPVLHDILAWDDNAIESAIGGGWKVSASVASITQRGVQGMT